MIITDGLLGFATFVGGLDNVSIVWIQEGSGWSKDSSVTDNSKSTP